MTELCRRNLQQSLARAAARTEELNNWPKPPPFELPGVLPEQEEAARLLLQELDKVSP